MAIFRNLWQGLRNRVVCWLTGENNAQSDYTQGIHGPAIRQETSAPNPDDGAALNIGDLLTTIDRLNSENVQLVRQVEISDGCYRICKRELDDLIDQNGDLDNRVNYLENENRDLRAALQDATARNAPAEGAAAGQEPNLVEMSPESSEVTSAPSDTLSDSNTDDPVQVMVGSETDDASDPNQEAEIAGPSRRRRRRARNNIYERLQRLNAMQGDEIEQLRSTNEELEARIDALVREKQAQSALAAERGASVNGALNENEILAANRVSSAAGRYA